MYISIGDKTYDVNNTIIFKLGKLKNPKFVHYQFIYNGVVRDIGKHKITSIDTENHIIYCDNEHVFRYYDGCYYLELCQLEEDE